jgi:hypothetical protein
MVRTGQIGGGVLDLPSEPRKYAEVPLDRTVLVRAGATQVEPLLSGSEADPMRSILSRAPTPNLRSWHRPFTCTA